MKPKYSLLFLLLILATPCAAKTIKMEKIQFAHLAGSWYPAQKNELQKDLAYYFSLAKTYFPVANDNNVSALIVPHAGYRFSGLCAATAYQAIKNKTFDRIIILAPSHKKSFDGIALPDYTKYQTPLGTVSVDKKTIMQLAKHPLLKKVPKVHSEEHSVEIQLPFLQSCLDNFLIVPLLIGNLQEKDFETVAEIISSLLRSDKTLIVVSSDFIHYGPRFEYTPPFADALRYNKMAIEAICKKSYAQFDAIVKKTKATICGKDAIKILLKLISMDALGHVNCQLTCAYNSAQIEKSYDGKKINASKLSETVQAKSFVSYAGMVFTTQLTQQEKKALLELARTAIAKKLFPEKKIKDPRFALTEKLKKATGTFITLKTKDGKLRGCIGRIISDTPLYKLVAEMAVSSAFHDSRFSPLTKKELDNVTLSVTILTPPQTVKSYKDIVIGKHGVILEKTVNGQKRSAVYLPQVAPEQGWNLEQTLNSLSQKAGLPKDGWRENTQFKVFEGFEFDE